MDELLKKGYKIDEDGDIYVGGDDEFFVKGCTVTLPLQYFFNSLYIILQYSFTILL